MGSGYLPLNTRHVKVICRATIPAFISLMEFGNKGRRVNFSPGRTRLAFNPSLEAGQTKGGIQVVTSQLRGNLIVYRKQWEYEDGDPITKERPCARCGNMPTKDGHDYCLQHLEGVIAACCGHGVEDGYLIRGD